MGGEAGETSVVSDSDTGSTPLLHREGGAASAAVSSRAG